MVETISAQPLTLSAAGATGSPGLEPGTEFKAKVEANLPGGVVRLATADGKLDLRVQTALPPGKEVMVTVTGDKQNRAIQITVTGTADKGATGTQTPQQAPAGTTSAAPVAARATPPAETVASARPGNFATSQSQAVQTTAVPRQNPETIAASTKTAPDTNASNPPRSVLGQLASQPGSQTEGQALPANSQTNRPQTAPSTAPLSQPRDAVLPARTSAASIPQVSGQQAGRNSPDPGGLPPNRATGQEGAPRSVAPEAVQPVLNAGRTPPVATQIGGTVQPEAAAKLSQLAKTPGSVATPAANQGQNTAQLVTQAQVHSPTAGSPQTPGVQTGSTPPAVQQLPTGPLSSSPSLPNPTPGAGQNIVGSLSPAQFGGLSDATHSSPRPSQPTGQTAQPAANALTQSASTTTLGTQQPGTQQPGIQQPRPPQSRTPQPGTPMAGTQQSGVQQAGAQQAGAQQAATQSAGNRPPGTQQTGAQPAATQLAGSGHSANQDVGARPAGSGQVQAAASGRAGLGQSIQGIRLTGALAQPIQAQAQPIQAQLYQSSSALSLTGATGVTEATATPAERSPAGRIAGLAMQPLAEQQSGLGGLFAQVSAMSSAQSNGQVSLPDPVVKAMQQILGLRVNATQNPGGSDLQQAVRSSGQFREASLAAFRPGASAPVMDLKSALLSFKSLLQHLGADAQITRPASQPAAPSRQGLPQAQAPQTASGFWSGGAPQNLQTLLKETDVALARIRMTQLVNSGLAGDERPQVGSRPMDLVLELPLAFGQETSVMQMQIGRDGGGTGENEDTDPAWRLRFAMDLSSTGPLEAAVSLRGGSTFVSLWVDRKETYNSLDAVRETIEAAFADAGLDLQEFRLVRGLPQRVAEKYGALIDRQS